MNNRLGWGILGTGRIAGIFAEGLTYVETGKLVAVASRSEDKAEQFAAEHHASRAHGSYEALLADPEVEAAYIGTPHPQHVEWVVRAAEAGKHILCEKPIGVNHAETMVMVAAAREHGVMLMEAFMYRCHPQLAKVIEIVSSGVLGDIKLIQAEFGFQAPCNAESRLWANDAAGGGIMDVGCYPISFTRRIAGVITGEPFLNPTEVTGTGQLHPESGVDAVATASLKFASGLVAQITTSVELSLDSGARLYGTDGMLHIPDPWNPPADKKELLIHRHEGGQLVETYTVPAPSNQYGREADTFAQALSEDKREVSAMPLADTLGNMQTLDAWRSAIGLTYEQEKPENFKHIHARRPLRKRTT